MSKKGENIYKRKDGRWEGRYIVSYTTEGKAKFGYIYGKTYCEVKHRLIEKKNAVFQNTVVIDKCSATYSEVLDAWLNSSKINTKESTYARYSHLIKNYLKGCKCVWQQTRRPRHGRKQKRNTCLQQNYIVAIVGG